MSQYGPPPDEHQYGGGHDRPPPPAQQGGKGMAITALVLGVLSLLLFWTVVGGILLGLIAFVLGLIASSRAKKGRSGGRGLAIAGWITGLLGLVLGIVIITFGGILFARIFDSESYQQYVDCQEQAGEDQTALDQCAQDFEDGIERDFGG